MTKSLRHMFYNNNNNTATTTTDAHNVNNVPPVVVVCCRNESEVEVESVDSMGQSRHSRRRRNRNPTKKKRSEHHHRTPHTSSRSQYVAHATTTEDLASTSPFQCGAEDVLLVGMMDQRCHLDDDLVTSQAHQGCQVHEALVAQGLGQAFQSIDETVDSVVGLLFPLSQRSTIADSRPIRSMFACESSNPTIEVDYDGDASLIMSSKNNQEPGVLLSVVPRQSHRAKIKWLSSWAQRWNKKPRHQHQRGARGSSNNRGTKSVTFMDGKMPPCLISRSWSWTDGASLSSSGRLSLPRHGTETNSLLPAPQVRRQYSMEERDGPPVLSPKRLLCWVKHQKEINGPRYVHDDEETLQDGEICIHTIRMHRVPSEIHTK